ncbi:sigma-70 family RNA polymerase sigma factor [Streptomyces sp. NPDC017056]|uniref:sigma-70 family RNA polymerase sigma factor n=1 Tax=Streptomyces sp. NPDC017056 TaxID=3364973 RepID=UPI0037A9E3C6
MTTSPSIKYTTADVDTAALVRRFQSTTGRWARRALFDELYEIHYARLYGFCLKRLLPDRDAAQEALQETFLTAWSKLDRLEHPEALESWLYQIAWRRCAQQRRKRARDAAAPWADWEESAGRETARRLRQIAEDDADFTSRRRRALTLTRNIAVALGPGTQRFHDLYVGEELTGAELARRLGRATGSTKDHNEALRKAFRANVLAKDPRNREACGRLADILADAVASRAAEAAAAAVAGDHAAADRARRAVDALERFLADADSTDALPGAVCRTVTRHAGQCRTCQGSAKRSVARWFPVVAPFAFGELLVEAGRDDFGLVSASSPADGGPATEVKGPPGSQGGKRVRRSRVPARHRQGGRHSQGGTRRRVASSGGFAGGRRTPTASPRIGRRIAWNSLVALALGLGVVYGNGGTDLPMTQLPWSAAAPPEGSHGAPTASGGDSSSGTPSVSTPPGSTLSGSTPSGRTGTTSATAAPAPRSDPGAGSAASPSPGPSGSSSLAGAGQAAAPSPPPSEQPLEQPSEGEGEGQGENAVAGPSESQTPTSPPAESSETDNPVEPPAIKHQNALSRVVVGSFQEAEGPGAAGVPGEPG